MAVASEQHTSILTCRSCGADVELDIEFPLEVMVDQTTEAEAIRTLIDGVRCEDCR